MLSIGSTQGYFRSLRLRLRVFKPMNNIIYYTVSQTSLMYYLKIINISQNLQLKNINQNQAEIVVNSVPLMRFLFFVSISSL
jgi:hypothetical protein